MNFLCFLSAQWEVCLFVGALCRCTMGRCNCMNKYALKQMVTLDVNFKIWHMYGFLYIHTHEVCVCVSERSKMSPVPLQNIVQKSSSES